MSIIQEALKKARGLKTKKEPRFEGEVKEPPAPSKRYQPPAGDGSGKRPISVQVFYIIALFILIGVVLAINLYFEKGKYGDVAVENERPAPNTMPAPVKAKSPRTAPQDSGFTLNGIMYLIDKPQAVINDIIVEEGDTINGAVVTRIGKDKVLLNQDNGEISLDLNY